MVVTWAEFYKGFNMIRYWKMDPAIASLLYKLIISCITIIIFTFKFQITLTVGSAGVTILICLDVVKPIHCRGRSESYSFNNTFGYILSLSFYIFFAIWYGLFSYIYVVRIYGCLQHALDKKKPNPYDIVCWFCSTLIS